VSRVTPAAPEHGPARRARIRALLALVGAVVLVGGAALALRPVLGSEPDAPEALLTGRVVDERGVPVPGASVVVAGRTASADQDGAFRLPVPDRPVLVRADAPKHLSRTQAAEPGDPEVIRLTTGADETVSLRFGGDVMFGRRFYDRNEDGDGSDGLLPEDASVAEHRALLEPVEPLLRDADITVVNLETPILDDPWFDPTGPHPDVYHPTKEFVFASTPEAVEALAESGVDVVSLGNNHLYDALETALSRTLEALDAAGIPHFGAGRTVDEAWAPAFVERKGEVFAFLGCTTITGTEHPISYVADETHSGAARCTTERLDREVREARALADTVVLMIHGGEEYEADQTDVVRDLTAVALRADAVIAVNGHPHVVGGVVADGRSVAAETMGNLLFDQTVWPTFLSYLLRVDVRDGRPVLTTVDPLLLEDYVPRPTVGLLADSAARKAAGLPPGAMFLQDPGAVATGPPGPVPGPVRERALGAGQTARLSPGWWATGSAPGGTAPLAGEDLLWSTGSFEDMDTDPLTGGGHLWALGEHSEVSPAGACSGESGAVLRRSPVSTDDIVLTPQHRQLVTPGTRLSLLADVRDASPGSTLELRWYGDTKGPSSAQVTLDLPEVDGDPDCEAVRLDAVVPDGAVAVQPYVRLAPPGGVHLGAELAVDDVRLVAWGEPGAAGRRFDVLAADGADAVAVLADDRVAQQDGRDEPFADVAGR
jgi:hypothetical protein